MGVHSRSCKIYNFLGTLGTGVQTKTDKGTKRQGELSFCRTFSTDIDERDEGVEKVGGIG